MHAMYYITLHMYYITCICTALNRDTYPSLYPRQQNWLAGKPWVGGDNAIITLEIQYPRARWLLLINIMPPFWTRDHLGLWSINLYAQRYVSKAVNMATLVEVIDIMDEDHGGAEVVRPPPAFVEGLNNEVQWKQSSTRQLFYVFILTISCNFQYCSYHIHILHPGAQDTWSILDWNV